MYWGREVSRSVQQSGGSSEFLCGGLYGQQSGWKKGREFHLHNTLYMFEKALVVYFKDVGRGAVFGCDQKQTLR